MTSLSRRHFLSTAALLPMAFALPLPAFALAGGTLRVALTLDMATYDPQQFSTANFFLIRNLYDSLIDYDEAGTPSPALATAWTIPDDNRSVTLTLREDVTFHSGVKFDSGSVIATLEKGANPELGGNLYATIGIVESFEALGPYELKITFKSPAPTRQITDLLQFIFPIDPTGIDTVREIPAGTGPFLLENRQVGQSVTLTRNEAYWREKALLERMAFTIFSDDASATAALEAGEQDLIYSGQARTAVRLRDAGYQVITGPGKLVQVLRLNTTRAPFTVPAFRQAFNHLVNRSAILAAGYGNLGEITALPWAPASPAYDPSYLEEFDFNLDKARALLAQSGLSAAEMSDWKLLTQSNQPETVIISQILQATLAEVGIQIDLELKEGSEYIDTQLQGNYHATFGGVGNVQKFPTRVASNSIYRVTNNPVLGEPHPHQNYVTAIRTAEAALTEEEALTAYKALNEVLVEASFAIPTNSYETGLIVASSKVGGFTLDLDNLLIGRTLGFQ